MSDPLNFGGVSRNPPPWAGRRPMRLALLGDFGGGAGRGRLDGAAALAKRKPLKVEFDSLENALQRLSLRLTLPLGADGAPVEIEVGELESFHPDEIYRNVSLFSELSSLRKRLNTPASFAAAAAEVQSWGEEKLARASTISRRATARGSAPSRSATLDDFARLTGRASTAEQASGAVDDLLKRVVGPFIVPAANPQKDKLIAAVDAALTDAMRAVLQHPDFQTMESLWRGVDFLLRRLETSHQLQVHLFDISAEEFAADLSAHGDLAETGLYQLLVETPSQESDGGYAYVAGLYQFDATPPHAELLGRAANVCAHAGAPLLTAITTDTFADRREPPHRLVREAFDALRSMPNASYLALLGPRFLLRHPYGKKSDPISSFSFEEFSREAGLRGMLWGHPALLALAVLATRGGQLTIDDIPFHYYVDEEGDTVPLPCTDRLISTNTASLLREAGINGVMAHKGEALVRLAGLEAINGDGLGVDGAAPRKAAADTRGGVRADIDKEGATVTATWAPATRKAGAPGATAAPAAGVAPDEAAAAEEPAAEAAADQPAAEAASEAAAETSADDELAALLASLEEPSPPPSAPETPEETSADDELAALLKSLG